MTRRLLIALTCAAFVIAGCGSDEGTEAAVDADRSGETLADRGDETGAGAQGGEAEDDSDPCGVDLAPLIDEFDGLDMGAAIPGRGDHGVQDVKWTPRTCRWESPTVELRVAIAGPDDFPEGFVCAEPLGTWGEVEVLDSVGEQAWFEWNDFQGGAGRFSGCTGELRLDISVIGPRDGTPITEESARAAAVGLASGVI